MRGGRVTRCTGVDGCPAGWIVATRDRVEVVPTFDRALVHRGIVGVDMPIGLPTRGRRDADRAARALIGARRSSVFPTPQRDLLEFAGTAGRDGHAIANAATRARHGHGLSVQAFNLLRHIAEVDAALSPELAQRIIEVHPECSFRRLVGGELPTKHSVEGRSARRTALEPVFGALPAPPRGATEIDLLDAYAVLWSAERFAAGRHETLGDGERDARGLIMRIVV